jgi:hypothetical protein
MLVLQVVPLQQQCHRQQQQKHRSSAILVPCLCLLGPAVQQVGCIKLYLLQFTVYALFVVLPGCVCRLDTAGFFEGAGVCVMQVLLGC